MAGELARAVCVVMTRVRAVPETGYNQHGRYKYASDSDLLGAIQPAMAEAGLALVPRAVASTTVQHGESKAGNTKWRTDLVVTYDLLHVSGESTQVQAPGCGIDGDDKGTYKAMTGALKYALRHLFLVPTGDDAERGAGAGRPEPQQERQEQRREPEPDREVKPWDQAEWTRALDGAGLVLDEVLWFAQVHSSDHKHPKDMTPERRAQALTWFCSAQGIEQVKGKVNVVRMTFQAAFFKRWNVIYPPPRKKDGADDSQIEAANSYSDKCRMAVMKAWYGAESTKTIGIRAMLKGDFAMGWLQNVVQPDFEAAVNEVLGRADLNIGGDVADYQ